MHGFDYIQVDHRCSPVSSEWLYRKIFFSNFSNIYKKEWISISQKHFLNNLDSLKAIRFDF